jgi:hypothetical protein
MIVVVKDSKSVEIHECVTVLGEKNPKDDTYLAVRITSPDNNRWEAYHGDTVQVYSGDRLLITMDVRKDLSHD